MNSLMILKLTEVFDLKIITNLNNEKFNKIRLINNVIIIYFIFR
jgi:hypothetical protein